MKKIYFAAAAFSLIASVSFAEVKAGLTFKFYPDLITYESDDSALDDSATAEETVQTYNLFDMDGYATPTGAFSIKSSARYGGIELEIDPSIKTTVSSEGQNNLSTSLSVAKYNGWFKFANGFMLKAGAWDARSIPRLNENAGNFNSYDFEAVKPGLLTSITTHSLGVDISQQSGTSSAKQLSAMLEYANGYFELRGGAMYVSSLNLVKNISNKYLVSEYANYSMTGYVLNDTISIDPNVLFAEAVLKTGPVKTIVSFKSDIYEYAGSIYVNPQLSRNTNILVGATGEMVRYQNLSYAERNLFAYGAEVRFRQVFDARWSFTTYNNVTFNEHEYGSEGEIARYMAMENMANITMRVNPYFRVTLTGRHYTGDYDTVTGSNYLYKPALLKTYKTDEDGDTTEEILWTSNFRITPGVEYTFGDNCKLTGAVAVNLLNCFNEEIPTVVCKVEVPVMMVVTF